MQIAASIIKLDYFYYHFSFITVYMYGVSESRELLTDNRTMRSKCTNTGTFRWYCEVGKSPLRFNIISQESDFGESKINVKKLILRFNLFFEAYVFYLNVSIKP